MLEGLSSLILNIRLSWDGLPETNALAYFSEKKFYKIDFRTLILGKPSFSTSSS